MYGRSRLSHGTSRISGGRSRVSNGLAAEPGHGQVELGAKEVARTWTGPRNGGPAPMAWLALHAIRYPRKPARYPRTPIRYLRTPFRYPRTPIGYHACSYTYSHALLAHSCECSLVLIVMFCWPYFGGGSQQMRSIPLCTGPTEFHGLATLNQLPKLMLVNLGF